ncbi:MAG: periplasmic heavy metal sensor [Bacteroidetes bacterium]|nr:periplasmic heavy metal sensor [Bacteroidota bacterium]
MDILENKKFTGATLLLLLVLNSALLVILVMRHHGPPMRPPFPPMRPDMQMPGGPHAGPRDFLVHELDLNSDQQKKFDDMIFAHRQLMEELQRKIHDHRDSLIHELGKNNSDSSLVNSLTMEIGADQAAIEKNNFNHFRSLRMICTDQQKLKFDSVITIALHMMGPEGHPHPHSPGNF